MTIKPSKEDEQFYGIDSKGVLYALSMDTKGAPEDGDAWVHVEKSAFDDSELPEFISQMTKLFKKKVKVTG